MKAYFVTHRDLFRNNETFLKLRNKYQREKEIFTEKEKLLKNREPDNIFKNTKSL